MNKGNILIILEGKHPDIKLLEKINELLNLGFLVKIIFGADIYELYRSIYEDPFTRITDSSVLNTFDLIKSSDSETFKNHNQTILQEYIAQDFAFIYLFFDFDPWAATESRPLTVIKDMLELFNNPTEQGKLYINYPTIESFNHITSDFKNLSFNHKCNDRYKKVAGAYSPEFSDYQDIRKISHAHLLEISTLHIKKANFICKNDFSIPNDIKDISQLEIFDKQFALCNSNNETYVVSSIPLFLFEMLGFNNLSSLLSI